MSLSCLRNCRIDDIVVWANGKYRDAKELELRVVDLYDEGNGTLPIVVSLHKYCDGHYCSSDRRALYPSSANFIVSIKKAQ